MSAPVPERRIPGPGAAAAVLGFVEAGFALVLVATILVDEADRHGGGGDTGIVGLVLVLLLGMSGLTAVGSLLLVRGHGRALLVAATIAELILLVGLWVVALVEFAGDSIVEYDGATWAAATALVVVAGILPVVRLVLVSRPAVDVWLATHPGSAPPWSLELQQWMPGRGSAVGPVLAVLTPVLVLLAMTVVVLTTGNGGEVVYDQPVPPR